MLCGNGFSTWWSGWSIAGHAFGLNMGPSLLTDLHLDRLKQGLILPSLS